MGRAELNILQNNERGNKSTILSNYHQSIIALFVIKGHFNWYHFDCLVFTRLYTSSSQQSEKGLQNYRYVESDNYPLFCLLVTEYRPSLLLNHYFFRACQDRSIIMLNVDRSDGKINSEELDREPDTIIQPENF